MPTIKDVASLANVSVATVSRVLNNRENVDERTRKIVLEAISSLSYVPNETARSLFTKQTRTVGVIIPNLSSSYMGGLVEIFEDALIRKGYRLMICNSQDDPDREAKYLQVFQTFNVDGILLVSNTSRLEDYLSLGIPLVAIDHGPGEDIPSVTSANAEGGRIAARRLLDGGAKKILHFRGPSHLFTVRERTKGLEEILGRRKIPLFTFDLAFRNPDEKLIEGVLAPNAECDGIFCDSDLIALHVIQVLKRLGRRIPEDVQVIGFDDISFSSFLLPRLTTIRQNTREIGGSAVEMLTELMAGRPLDSPYREIPVSLVERETTKPLKKT